MPGNNINFSKEARDLKHALADNAYPAADGTADIDNNALPIIEATLRNICARALTAGLAAMWRPISEAPKDGTWFLAWQDEERGPFKCWMHQGFSADEYYWMDHFDSEPDPTHWQPLPSPPTPAKEVG